MQLTYAAAIAALSATVFADVADVSFNFNTTCDDGKPLARVVNRCPYTVYAWSVATGSRYDCDLGKPAVIPPGGVYQENYRTPANGGISIKLTKDSQCKHGSITQLEYHLETNSAGGLYNFNSLDVSYVDCQNNDCPTRQEGYYLQSGNEGGKYATAGADKAICPILSCTDKASCDKCSYVDPNDIQTKTCDNGANLYFYMCGGEKPGSEPKAPSSSKEAAPSKTHEEQKPSTTAVQEAKVDAVTPTTSEKPHVVKTEVVYETVYVKRHAHGRRHQAFHA